MRVIQHKRKKLKGVEKMEEQMKVVVAVICIGIGTFPMWIPIIGDIVDNYRKKKGTYKKPPPENPFMQVIKNEKSDINYKYASDNDIFY